MPICTYCTNSSTTMDHLPPKNMFASPRPYDTITVPCCESCRVATSKHDEAFRDVISLQIESGSAASEIRDKAMRSLNRDGGKNRKRALLEASGRRPINVEGPDGVIRVRKIMDCKYEYGPVESVLDRIAYGIYRKFETNPATFKDRVNVWRIARQDSETALIELEWATRHLGRHGSIGQKQFEYWYYRSTISVMWSLLFFEGVRYFGMIADKELLIRCTKKDS